MIKSLRWNYYITSIILIVLGILTFRYPVEAIMSIGFIIGMGLIISGLNYFSAFYFFGLKRFILLGILDFIAGIYMTVQPGMAGFVIPFVIGLWLFSAGLSRIGVALWLGGAKISGWWLMLINGIALIILALFMGASPLVSSLSVMMILAFVLILHGILAFIEGFMMFR